MVNKPKSIATAAVFGVVAFLIMFLELNIPLMPFFLKLDISELPALLVGLFIGPIQGVMVVLIKNLMHLMVSTNLGIGELANFIMGTSFVASTSYFYQHKKLEVLNSLMIGCLMLIVISILTNLFVIIPLYEIILNISLEDILELAKRVNPLVKDLKTYLLFIIAPFNILKGGLLTVITYLMFKKLGKLNFQQKGGDSIHEKRISV